MSKIKGILGHHGLGDLKAYGISPPAPCIRIGVQEDIFVFDHILHFDQYPRVQLG